MESRASYDHLENGRAALGADQLLDLSCKGLGYGVVFKLVCRDCGGAIL